jgi:hypothetical protein
MRVADPRSLAYRRHASDGDGQIAVDQRLSTMIRRARVTTMGKPVPTGATLDDVGNRL